MCRSGWPGRCSYEDAGYEKSDLRKVRSGVWLWFRVQCSALAARGVCVGPPKCTHWLAAAVRSSQMTFLLNHKPVDALALIVHAGNVEETGRYWVEKLCT